MKANQTLRRAILAILSTPAVTFSVDALAADPVAAPEESIGEVIVTAQRRSERLQDVPISIQALTGETLADLKVSTLEDFVKYLPSVTTASLGPAQGNIYMRGLSVGALGTQGQGSVGQWPNVAVYLDEQSTQIPGRNLDVYAADLERIEVLEGPQGTLFGAGAQAGVLRYITRKPKQGVTEGYLIAGYGTTAHGSESGKVEGAINFPVTDKLALRAVIYNDSRGGYIDNVYSSFTRRSTDFGIAGRAGGIVPAESVVINNGDIVANDINSLTYKGLRIGAAYDINDDWNLLISQTYQEMNAGGVFYQLPFGSDCTVPTDASTCTFDPNPNRPLPQGAPLKDLQVTVFNTGRTDDKFSNTALTINGKIGSFELAYAGAYLTRDSFQTQDYTNYARGVYGSYYQCTGYSGASVDRCYTPSSVWHDTTKNINQSHELRFSTPSEWRVSGVVGAFWEKRNLNDQTDWLYKSVPECSVGGPASCFLWLDPSAAPKFQDASLNNPNRRGSNVGFFDDFKRTYEQTALFASVDWHIVDSLTLTVGTRWYDIKNEMLGGNVGSFFCKVYGTGEVGPCNGNLYGRGDTVAPYGTNLDRQDPNSSTSDGFKSRANISWKAGDDLLFYGTWSEGYRPGGFNRGTACHLRTVDPDPGTGQRTPQWCVPAAYDSDDLVNKEIGWKTTFANNRVQFNGAIYEETWSNVQTGIFAPQLGLGNLTVGLNGPTNRVRGIEVSFIALATEGLTLQGSASYNKGELTKSPQLINNIPGSPGFGQPVTNTFVDAGHPNVEVRDVFGVPGDALANAPKLQMNARARYAWGIDNSRYYVQAGFAHQDSSLSSATIVNQYEMPSWNTFDLSLGMTRGSMGIDLVVQNLTDENKSLFTSAAQFIVAEVPMRPRTIGVQFSYNFAGN